MKHDVIFSGATTPRIRVGRVLGRLCLWNLVWALLAGFPRPHAMTLHAVFDGWFGSSSHVLDDDGMLWSWGANAGGQLADGTKNAAVNARKLALPPGVSRWVQFRGGAAFALLDDQGRLFGWGPTEFAGGVGSPIQRTPILLNDLKWKCIAVPSTRSGLAGVPWGLGITASGALRWIRIPAPSLTGDTAFSGRRLEEPVGLDPSLTFVDVAAGRHMYLALSKSGKLYACGVGAWGVLGPEGDMGSSNFVSTFVEVPVPVGGTSWKRLGEADTQAFGWTQQDELYVWGRRFEGKSNLNWEWVTDSTPRHVVRAPNGSPWIAVAGFGENQPDTYLMNEARQLWVTGDGLDILARRQLASLSPDWSPVRTFDIGGSHRLFLGSDGRVRATGLNEDYQLGGFPGGELFTYPPVIPGGEAPFLLGRPADVPRVRLGSSGSLIVEPVLSGAAGTGSQTLFLKREGREDLPVFAAFDVRIRRLDGSWIPEPEASAILKEICPIHQRALMLGSQETQVALAMTPRRALGHDEDLWIDVELLSHPTYEIGEVSSVTFQYRHTVPQGIPPRVSLLWPPPNAPIFVGEFLDVVFQVSDQDGKAVRARLRPFRFVVGSMVTPLVLDLDQVPPGVKRTYHYRIPRNAMFGGYDPELTIQVFDDTGESTTVETGPLEVFIWRQHRLDVRLPSGIQSLTLGSAGAKVVLESSQDLATWVVEQSFTFPFPGLPSSPVQPAEVVDGLRFYRLRNLD